VCYFLAVGAIADAWRLSAFFEAQLDVDVASPQAPILAAFPAEDVVRLLTRSGCSCELLEACAPIGSAAPADAIWLTRECRRVLAAATAELGTIRIYVRSRRERQASRRPPRITMSVEELLDGEAALPANVLIDLVVDIPSCNLN
jgi:hypothetical protein